MPRYSITLRSSANPRHKRSMYHYAAGQFAAERFAERWLEVVRLTAFGPAAFDTWTVARKLSPHRPPEIVAHGGIGD